MAHVRALIGYHWSAAVILAAMFVLGLGSLRGDAPTFDETAHITAGYTYLKFGDDRLNPEHPPLIKDLAALPLLTLPLKFDARPPNWSNNPDAEWIGGRAFLYESGNPLNQILLLSRLPILLLAVLLGAGIYWFCLRRYGTATALLALVFYAFLPETLAHARYVTTDLGVTAFIFAALVLCAAWFKRPTPARFALAAVLLAAANLSKFSALVLYPTLLIVALAARQPRLGLRLRNVLLLFLASGAIIWGVYAWQSRNLSVAINDQLISYIQPTQVAGLLHGMNHAPILKPLVQYVLGLAFVGQRFDGNDSRITYLLGHTFVGHSPWYFPILFVFKTPLPLLMLLVAGGIFWWRTHRLRHGRWLQQLAAHNLVEFSFVVFIVLYGLLALFSNYNLGLRHLLPIMPPLIILVAHQTIRLVETLKPRAWPKLLLAGLMVWYVAGTLLVYPSFLAYFNELAGGPVHADRIAAHSNVDWGQDLGRLADYLKAHPEIDKLGLDYFGTAEPEYYLPRGRYTPWHAENGPYPGRYIAVSETILEYDRLTSAQHHRTGYAYLRASEPIAKIGYSIYVYKLH
jgi:Dolichyl-phosphate-mannose-protein mannosyltransferase